MPTERINTHQLKAGGCSDELGKHLQQIVDTLRQFPGSDTYMLDRCPEDDNRGTVSTHWQSEAALQAHYCCPEMQGCITLLDSRLASSVDCNNLPIVES